MRRTETSTRLLRAAIAGNPNSGKTSIFNELTGSNRCVGNYPGVTVERHEGLLRTGDRTLLMVDLPGTYSLTAYSAEEVVTRNFIIDERPDVVVDVVDAANLERNLYLTVQLMEMEVPLVIALNMIDVAKRHQVHIDAAAMSELLGIPVVETIGREGLGKEELAAASTRVASGEGGWQVREVTYGHLLDEQVESLAARIGQDDGVCRMYRPRWAAVRLIEKDPDVAAAIAKAADDPAGIREAAQAAVEEIETHSGDSVQSIVAEGRYGFAAGIVRQCVETSPGVRRRITDRVDAVVCNRVMGLGILAAIVYGMFAAVFKIADEWPWLLGRSPTEWMNWTFESLAGLVGGLQATSPMLHSLLADGVIGGVGGVMSFVPLIFIMFIFVAFLEDTGYIARVAFVLDRALRTFGLQGRSILAMIISGGWFSEMPVKPTISANRTATF